MLEEDGQPVPRKVSLSAEAYAHFRDWSHHLAKSTWNVSEIDRIMVPKLTGMVPRLALLLHALEAALEKSDCWSELSLPTMTAATKFGDWLYQHQKHIWSALGQESEPIKTPLDEAVMQATLALAEYLKDNQWRVLNDDFNPLVKSYLNQEVAGNQIGRAANRLGIKSITIGKKRGKEFSLEILERFRASFYL